MISEGPCIRKVDRPTVRLAMPGKVQVQFVPNLPSGPARSPHPAHPPTAQWRPAAPAAGPGSSPRRRRLESRELCRRVPPPSARRSAGSLAWPSHGRPHPARRSPRVRRSRTNRPHPPPLRHIGDFNRRVVPARRSDAPQSTLGLRSITGSGASPAGLRSNASVCSTCAPVPARTRRACSHSHPLFAARPAALTRMRNVASR